MLAENLNRMKLDLEQKPSLSDEENKAFAFVKFIDECDKEVQRFGVKAPLFAKNSIVIGLQPSPSQSQVCPNCNRQINS